MLGESLPVKPEIVTTGLQAGKSGTELRRETEITLWSHGTEEFCTMVLTVKMGSQMNNGAASPARPLATGCVTRSGVITVGLMTEVG